jgi:hypothetical protein
MKDLEWLPQHSKQPSFTGFYKLGRWTDSVPTHGGIARSHLSVGIKIPTRDEEVATMAVLPMTMSSSIVEKILVACGNCEL